MRQRKRNDWQHGKLHGGVRVNAAQSRAVEQPHREPLSPITHDEKANPGNAYDKAIMAPESTGTQGREASPRCSAESESVSGTAIPV